MEVAELSVEKTILKMRESRPHLVQTEVKLLFLSNHFISLEILSSILELNSNGF